jgi:dCTP deaminase
MILSDREVKAALNCGHLDINPRPPDDEGRWSPTTLDLTLDGPISEWREPSDPGHRVDITPGRGMGSDALVRLHTVERSCEAGYVLVPHGFVLAWTIETVRIDPLAGIGARVEGKSSLARLGLGIHVTAPTIHPGFVGPIRLEIWNIGPLRIELRKGMAICQVIFEKVFGLPTNVQGYAGQFRGQGPRRPRRRRGT